MHDGNADSQGDGVAGQVLELIRAEGVVALAGGFGVDDDLFLAGLDSMAVMQLLVALEERFGVAFAATDVTRERFQSARALGDWIRKQGRA